MPSLEHLLAVLSLPAVIALLGALGGAGLVAILKLFGGSGAKAEHTIEDGLDHALEVLAQVKQLYPNVVLDEAGVAVSALDKYLKAHDIPVDSPDVIKLAVDKALGKKA